MQRTENHYREILKKDRKNISALLGLAQFHAAKGKPKQAIVLLEKAVKLSPREVMLWGHLGDLYVAMMDRRRAARCFRQILKLDGGNLAAASRLSQMLQDQGDHEGAASLLEEMLSHHSDNYELLCNLGVVLALGNRHEQAVGYLQRAVEISPDHAAAWLNLGHSLKDTGRLADAREAYGNSLKKDDSLGEAYRHLSRLRKASGWDEFDQMAKSAVENGKLSILSRSDFAFGLGKLNEDLGDVALASRYYSQANRLKRNTLDYDVRQDLNHFETLAREVDAAYLESRKEKGLPGPEDIFITGFPRSGTTLVEQIITSHSHVAGGGELEDFRISLEEVLSAKAGTVNFSRLSMLKGADFKRIGRKYRERVAQWKLGRPILTNKLPHNFVWLGLISLALPEARIIHCRRDPMETCFSVFKSHFTGGLSFAYDFEELGRHYNGYQSLMDHWEETLGERILTVDYEALVENPEEMSRRMIAHCGLTWEPDCLDFHKNRNVVRTASAPQVRQPIYKSSVKASQKYRELLQPLEQYIGS